ncbi:hypothetical protein E2C01_063205 [Portunus trituberculatus]|uniref:Uncharacterized protein n=1 Tax=Portunus trituberculatus TaxID=210409 RepID=A0A5B7HD29_PORTR|nr:hypothetical protein [Portunus trituberculatus]
MHPHTTLPTSYLLAPLGTNLQSWHFIRAICLPRHHYDPAGGNKRLLNTCLGPAGSRSSGIGVKNSDK